MITEAIVERCVKARHSAPDGPWAFTRAALVEFLRILEERGSIVFVVGGEVLTGHDAFLAWHRSLTRKAMGQ